MRFARKSGPAATASAPRGAYTDEECAWTALLDRHRAGDPTALDSLAIALYPAIRRIVYRLAGSRQREAHEDLVQTALEQVWRSIDHFEGRSRLTSFVFGICYRVVARARRYDRVRSCYRGDAEAATTGDAPARADELYERACIVAAARTRLDALASDERAAFVMFEVEELPLEEVASALSCSTRTIKRRLRSARHKLCT